MFRERRGDRRRGYSPRGHYERLKKSGRLPRIGIAVVAFTIIAGISFGKCSDPTGPPSADSEAGEIARPTTSTSSAPKTAGAIFATEIMPSINVCNGEVLTQPSGDGDFEYTYTREQSHTNIDGSGGLHITYHVRQKRSGKFANDGKGYSGEKYHQNSTFMTKSNPHHQTVKHHVVTKEEGEPADPQWLIKEKRSWNEDVEYDLVVVEDPITGNVTMTATALKITPSCLPEP